MLSPKKSWLMRYQKQARSLRLQQPNQRQQQRRPQQQPRCQQLRHHLAPHGSGHDSLRRCSWMPASATSMLHGAPSAA